MKKKLNIYRPQPVAFILSRVMNVITFVSYTINNFERLMIDISNICQIIDIVGQQPIRWRYTMLSNAHLKKFSNTYIPACHYIGATFLHTTLTCSNTHFTKHSPSSVSGKSPAINLSSSMALTWFRVRQGLINACAMSLAISSTGKLF